MTLDEANALMTELPANTQSVAAAELLRLYSAA